MRASRILVIDDQQSARELFARFLDPRKYEVVLAEGVEQGLVAAGDAPPAVIVTDVRLGGMDGISGMDLFHARFPDAPIVVMTAFATVETAVDAMKKGAFDYIRKPFDMDEMAIILDRAVAHRQLLTENIRLREEVHGRYDSRNIVAKSPRMKMVLDLVDRVAPTDVTVLITGESGTGKDVIARAIHYRSRRATAPFLSLNCCAIPDALLESELFGYEKGAFSGATTSKSGFFAEADGGTLFLDEIGDMSLSLQPKLLRVLQDGEFFPVGGRRPLKTDVRILCATNKPLETLMTENTFREDLYYRIHKVVMNLPPLRERTEDIPLFVEHFLRKLAEKHHLPPRTVSPEAMRALMEHSWPGNVRELENVLERAALVCNQTLIGRTDLPPEVLSHAPAHAPAADISCYRDARQKFEADYLRRCLEAAGGNVAEAAERAGIHRTTFYEKMQKLGLDPA